MKISSWLFALALVSCDRGVTVAENPSAAAPSTDAPVVHDWRDLFGPYVYPQSLELATKFRCPNMVDVPKFVKSLWPHWIAAQGKWDRDRKTGVVNPQDLSDEVFDRAMLQHIRNAGCKPEKKAIPVQRIITWDSLSKSYGSGVEYVNAERWIAYESSGLSKGFVLARSVTVD